MSDKLVSLYVDKATWDDYILVDDFLVAIGKTKSNSVYHIAEVKEKVLKGKRIRRFYVKCYRSDLITMLNRDGNQGIHPITW